MKDWSPEARAIEGDWPLTPAQLVKCVTRLEEALDDSTSPRDVSRIVACFARLQAQNLQARLAKDYNAAIGEQVMTASVQEVLGAMVRSLPLVASEYTGEDIIEAEKPDWPIPALPVLPPSCSSEA